MLRLALLATLALLAPTALAQETLDDLEAPHVHTGADSKVWNVEITDAEAGKPRAVVFRNAVGHPFRLIVYDEGGAEVFKKEGSRGVQTLPALEAGQYRFFVDRPASFQVTGRALARDGLDNVSTTLDGTTDAYVLAATKHYRVNFTGDVRVEWLDMTSAPEDLVPPASRDVRVGGAYVMTVTGAEGASYAITLTPTDAPPAEDETPGAWSVLAILALAGVALARRR